MQELARRGGIKNTQTPGFEERQRKLQEGAARHRQRITSLGGKYHAGVPKGWTRDGIRKYRKNLRKYAKKILKRMIPHLSEEKKQELRDDVMAKEAMVGVIAISRDRSVKPEVRLSAYRTVLEWTKQKPATKAEHTIKKAEDFLAALAAKDETDGRQAPSGSSASEG